MQKFGFVTSTNPNEKLTEIFKPRIVSQGIAIKWSIIGYGGTMGLIFKGARN